MTSHWVNQLHSTQEIKINYLKKNVKCVGITIGIPDVRFKCECISFWYALYNFTRVSLEIWRRRMITEPSIEDTEPDIEPSDPKPSCERSVTLKLIQIKILDIQIQPTNFSMLRMQLCTLNYGLVCNFHRNKFLFRLYIE